MDNSFLQSYKTYSEGNESHPNFHMWCAMVALSSACSRRVWVPQGYYNVYANLYIVLVGPPASRKTTAMSICKKLLRELKNVPFSAEATTKEALIREMADNQRSFQNPGTGHPIQYAPITVCVTELSQFLAASKENMVDFLTTVWDQDFYDYKTKNKGANGERNSDEIFGPYLNLLGCTTPSWISSYLKQDVISGGFSRRAIFVYQDTRDRRITFPEITPTMAAAWTNVQRIAKRIQDLKGEFKWHPDAEAFYHKWYQTHEIKQVPSLLGYYDSKQILVIKIAMLFALSERQELLLTVDDIENALDLLELTEKNMARVFEGVGRNELAMTQGVFQEIIVRAGGRVSDVALRRDTFSLVNQQEYEEVVAYLYKTLQWQQASAGGKTFHVTASYAAQLKQQAAKPTQDGQPGTEGSSADSSEK